LAAQTHAVSRHRRHTKYMAYPPCALLPLSKANCVSIKGCDVRGYAESGVSLQLAEHLYQGLGESLCGNDFGV
jgi:hypothetical protein